MTTIALIPARGGSKRLPRKNVLNLLGKPMLVYAIDTARDAGLFDEIYVSTEDDEISQVADDHGAMVITRPKDLSTDRSTVVDVCLHALSVLPDVVKFCCIYPTSVLIRPESIHAGYKLLDADPEADFVMGVSEYENPPVQALKRDSQGFLNYMWPEWSGVQSQFHPELLVSNGSFYWARRDAFLSEKTFYGKRLRGLQIPSDECSDINTLHDLKVTRKKLEDRINVCK